MSVTSPGNLTPQSREITLDEWGALDEDEPGELVDGRLVEEEVPTFLHEFAVSWLVTQLVAWGTRREIWILTADAKFGVAARRGRKPDVSVYFRGAPRPKLRDSVARVPPSIAIEVVSEPARDVRRDRIEKAAEYASFGVRFYWLLDPFRRTFEVLELGADARYTIALSVADGAHAVPGCDDLVLDLSGLWQQIDAESDHD